MASKEARQTIQRATELVRGDAGPPRVDLSELGVDDEALEALAMGLERNITLEGLALRRSAFGPRGLGVLCKALAGNLHLVRLDLSGNHLGAAGLGVVADLVARNQGLCELALNDAALTDAGSERAIDVSGLLRLAQQLGANHCLRRLEMAGNCLTDYGENERGLDALLTACAGHVQLEALDLSRNGLGASGAARIAERLGGGGARGHLLELALADNRLLPDGARALARLLLAHRALRKLDLRSNDLACAGDLGGVRALFGSLRTSVADGDYANDGPRLTGQYNDTLWRLDLRGNKLAGSEAEVELAELLRFNCSLVDVRLLDTKPFLAPAAAERVALNEQVQRALAVCSSDSAPTMTTAQLVHGVVRARSTVALIRLGPSLSPTILATPCGDSKTTALHEAVRAPEKWIIKTLMACGAPLDRADRNGDTPLHLAFRAGDAALSLLLIECGAPLTVRNRHGLSPSECAATEALREEALKCAGRPDVLVVCAAEETERQIASELMFWLQRTHNISAAFLTAEEALQNADYPQLYCAAVVAVVGAFTGHARALATLVDRARDGERRLRAQAEDAPEPEMRTPLLAVLAAPDAHKAAAREPWLADATTFDVREWAGALGDYLEAQAAKMAAARAPRRGEDALGVLLRRKALDKLKAAAPSPEGASAEALDDLALRVKRLGRYRRAAATSRLANAVGACSTAAYVKTLLSHNRPYAVVLDMSRNPALAANVCAELDRLGVAAWAWPRGAPPPGCEERAYIETTGLRNARAALVIRPPAVDHRDRDEAADRALRLLEEAKSNDPQQRQTLLVAAHVVPAQRAVAPALPQLALPADGEPRAALQSTAAQAAHLLRGAWSGEAAPGLEQARVAELERQLAAQTRLLRISRALNDELAGTVSAYRQRWRRAVEVLNPPPPRAAWDEHLARLRQERLRLAAGKAGPRDLVRTEVFDDLVNMGLEVPAALRERAQAEGVARAELEVLLATEERVARQGAAAVLIQAAWRGSWARELRRRAEQHVAARRVQRAYRAYRWRRLAWMY